MPVNQTTDQRTGFCSPLAVPSIDAIIAAAKLVASILTDNGQPVYSPDDGTLDDVEMERWNVCMEIVRRLNVTATPELVTLEGDDIVIRITPDALKFASENGALCTFSSETNGFRKARVTDLVAWRKEVVGALRREAENGDTPVHLLLDGALEWAAEQGGDGIWIEGVHDV